MCVNSKNQAYVPTVYMYLENQASIQNRLLYEIGFSTLYYSGHGNPVE